jgi:hypothetical protein
MFAVEMKRMLLIACQLSFTAYAEHYLPKGEAV